MNVLMISPLTPESGSAIQFWSMCRELGKLGHNVYFLERALFRNQKKTSRNVRYFRTIDVFPFLPLNILLSLIFNVVVSIFIKADIVFVLKPLPNSCIPAIMKKLFGAKIILDIDDLDYEFYKNNILKKIMFLFFEVFPRFFDGITFCSRKLMNYTKDEVKLCKKDIIFRPQGIDYASFQDIEYKKELEEQLGLGRCNTLVYLASLGITTALTVVLEVFKNICQKRKGVKMLVIGGGNNLNSFIKKSKEIGIEDKVVFTGFVEHNMVPFYLKLGDIAINYMELSEANMYRVPIKSREYLALGMPVVSNIAGDDLDIAKYLYLCKDAKDFEVTIIDILDGYGDERNLAGKQFVKENYNWSNIVEDLTSHFNNILIEKN